MKYTSVSLLTQRLVGHTIVSLMKVGSLAMPRGYARRSTAAAQTPELDRTGILSHSATRLEVRHKDDEVIFPFYPDSLAHSFWRAQEFSLLMQNMDVLRHPVLDLGCGDGSFAAVLFDSIEYGVDIDQEALAIAKEFRVYSQLIHAGVTHIPLPDASVHSVFSNSVLEHVQELDPLISEVGRILSADGRFVFSVPVAQFARDLTMLFGKTESKNVNDDYFHRNLLEIDAWRSLLDKHGLAVVSIHQYQPVWFSFYYWMFRFLGRRGLGRVYPNIREHVWRRSKTRIVHMVRRSIGNSTAIGGNIFVIARKASV